MGRGLLGDIYLITDRHQVTAGHDLYSTLAAALEGGVRSIQLREKDLSDAELLPLARDLRKLTDRYQAQLLVNDRLEVARAIAADGVHLGGHSLPVAEARKRLGPNFLIGVSTHSLPEVRTAEAAGADFVTFGPVFFTPSKAAYGEPVGLSALAKAAVSANLPVYALGGITPERAKLALATGAKGIALISAIIAAADPCLATKAFKYQD